MGAVMLKAKVPRRDRRITLMQPVEVSSTSGGPKFSGYELLDEDPEPYARIMNKPGGEVVQNDQITHVQQTIFTVRYREDINLNVKIVYNSKMYAILSFTESGETRRRFTDITAEFFKEYVIT
jgi:SPP1 family predicted phage head-tail adaptor